MTKYLYVGKRITTKGNKLVHAFVAQDDKERGNFTFWPKAKAHHFMGAQIGKIYEFTDDRLPEIWSEAECGEVPENERLAYQVESRAEELKKRETGKEPAPELTDMIDRLRRARAKIAPNQRLNFDLWVLNSIR